jgi:2-keto-4-pentenoate hydratase/2-oxohepta-3-ene-1,7-dioic acid hydratase in catechol pathway
MKICKYILNDEIKFGAVKDDLIFPLDNISDLEKDAESLSLENPVSFSDVEFLPPVIPSKIVCVGRNYAAHAAELGNEVPKEPLLFLKAPSSLIVDGEDIVIPEQSEQVEHEGELALIIGRECRKLTENDNPFDYVFGYLCLNDVTARDVQKKDVQFTRGKSFDTFCPIGSIIETELDVSDIRVTTKVNGEIRQDGRTSQMVFPVDFLIRYISNQMTLNAGDIIATGTPSGVSKMVSGDVCEVEIEGIGVLRNTVK